MNLSAALDHAEDLAESDLGAAISSLKSTLIEVRGEPDQAARVQLVLGALTARSGDLDAAVALLDLAEATAVTPTLRLEARVTRCSVLGAMGHFDQALPALRSAVRDLKIAAPSSELLADAQAELRAFENLVSPKNQATWAALASKS